MINDYNLELQDGGTCWQNFNFVFFYFSDLLNALSSSLLVEENHIQNNQGCNQGNNTQDAGSNLGQVEDR